VTYWGLRWQGPAGPALSVAAATAPATAAVDSAAVARLLGGPGASAAPAVGAPNRLALAGVVARSSSRTGAALIAIDGKPAKAFSVGSRVEDGLYLLSVAPRRASLGASLDGPASISLDLPAPLAAASSAPGRGESATVAVPVAPTAAPAVAARRLRPAKTGDTGD
jgi:general secretion pathway protein C